MLPFQRYVRSTCKDRRRELSTGTLRQSVGLATGTIGARTENIMMSFVSAHDDVFCVDMQHKSCFEQQTAVTVPFAGSLESRLSIASTVSSGSNGAAEYDTDTTSDKSTAESLGSTRGSEPVRQNQDTVEHPDLFRCVPPDPQDIHVVDAVHG